MTKSRPKAEGVIRLFEGAKSGDLPFAVVFCWIGNNPMNEKPLA